MRKISQCDRCKFYAQSDHLVCAIHPFGIAQEENSCPDFDTLSYIVSSENSHKRMSLEDLNLAETIIRQYNHLEREEANRNIAQIIAEAWYDPIEELLKQSLSDTFYYVLILAQLLANQHRYIDNPDEYYAQMEADNHSILVHQAKHLVSHGSEEVISWEKRRNLYGNDDYIARRIANYLSYGNELVSFRQKQYLDDMLERISANANLHGFNAIGRLRGSTLLFDYEYPSDFDIDEWKQNWQDVNRYPPVLFSVSRTIAFVKARFDIVLDYPFERCSKTS